MEYQKIILIAAQEGDNPKNGEKEAVLKTVLYLLIHN